MAQLIATFDAGDGFTFRTYEITKNGAPAYSVGLWDAEDQPVLIGGIGTVRIWKDRECAILAAEGRAQLSRRGLETLRIHAESLS